MESTTVLIRTIKKVSEEMNIPYQEVSKMVDVLFRSTKEKINMEDMPTILWRGFGTFKVKPGTLKREIERMYKFDQVDPERIETYNKIIERREHEEIRRKQKPRKHSKV